MIILNKHNWRSSFNFLRVIANPFVFVRYLLRPGGNPTIVVRTPTGKISLKLRNYETAKTIFSVFCRNDYLCDESETVFLDLGSNVGIATAYFLSRNSNNRVIGVEPDPDNIPFLKVNTAPFGGRFLHKAVAAGVDENPLRFYCSPDGKYSTTIKSEAMTDWKELEVPGCALSTLCADAVSLAEELPVVVKIDVEGLEETLVQSVDFSLYPKITRVIVESKTCSKLIQRPHNRIVRNGYIEDLVFT